MKKSFLLLALALCGSTIYAQEKTEEIRYNQYGAAVSRTSLDAEARNGILVFESKDQQYRFWFDIRVQTDGAVFFGDTYNEIGNGASIRRARIAAKVALPNNWYGEIDFGMPNGVGELNDALVGKHITDNWDVKIGNFKENFSMEQTTTSRYLTFMERAMVVSALAPSRHIGVQTSYANDLYMVSGGVFFQEVEDAEMRTYVEDKNKAGVNEGISYTGKLVFQPHSLSKGMLLGVAGSYRTPKTSAEVEGSVRYSSRALSGINRRKYLDTDDITDVKYDLLGNVTLGGFYEGLKFQSEYIVNQTNRKNDLGKYTFGGWYAQASYLLFGGKQRYNQNEAEFTQPSFGKSWGDVEVAFRYDYLDLNSKDIMGGSGEGYTFGLTYFASHNVKFELNYSIINNDRYANGKGKFLIGKDAAGELTKDPTKVVDAKGKSGEDFSFVGVRCEIDF